MKIRYQELSKKVRLRKHLVRGSAHEQQPQHVIGIGGLRGLDSATDLVWRPDQAQCGIGSDMAESEGICAEPSVLSGSATVESPVTKGRIPSDTTLVAFLASKGPSDTETATCHLEAPPLIEPKLEAMAAPVNKSYALHGVGPG